MLQWLNLNQSIYNKQGQKTSPQRSPISQVLTPQRKSSGTMDTSNRFVEEQKAKWAEEDKLKKLERDRQTQGAQELGMRMGKAMQGQQQGAMAQAEQKAAANKQIESNPEPAAKEMYELLKTLPDEAKSQLLNQIFTPTTPKGGISSGGKTVTMLEKYNPIAQIFIDKGWAMFDAKGNVNLSEPEREFEKGTFELVEKGGKVYKFNTATNEEIELGSVDEPEGTVNEIVKQINSDAIEVVKTSDNKVSLEDAKHDAALDYGLSENEAKELAKFTGMPKDEKDKNKLIEWFKNWFKSKAPKQATKEDWEKAAGKIAGETFNEAKASVLVDVISDDVTVAERAHFKSQGASDADIDEAIKRKGSK